ncbi:hypothetical protein [Nonomuraea sp. NPDC050691]|uniref:hypothetical protein n=1 Tax=Nonomuraea sp. NPDC050691 TaxID=3155661 RepID=UPI0033FBE8C3
MTDPRCSRHGTLIHLGTARPCAEDPDALAFEGTALVVLADLREGLGAQGFRLLELTAANVLMARRPDVGTIIAAPGSSLTVTRGSSPAAIRAALEAAVAFGNDSEECDGEHVHVRDQAQRDHLRGGSRHS